MHAIDIGQDRGEDESGIVPSGAAIWLAAAISALGGLLFGYDWVVIGGAKPFYEAAFALTSPNQQAWAVSCALIGCLIGALGSGVVSDRWGRKPALLLAAFVFTLSSLGTAASGNFGQFVLWRIFGGLAIGMASGLSPMYIAEIAPSAIRGKLVTCNQIAIVLGLLGAQIVNLLIARPVPDNASLAVIASSWNGTMGWRWMFAAAAVPALAFLLGLLLIPESPYWLARKGRWQECERVLARLGGPAYASATMMHMRRPAEENAGHGLMAIMRQPHLRKALLVGVVLALLQQWCGINVIFNYAQEIFASAGYAISDTLLNIVITGVVNCLATFGALMTVERWGRRRLLLIGCAGLAIIYLVLGGFYLVGFKGWPMLALVVAGIGCYAMTLAPVTWVALSEIFPRQARGTGMAIATTALWLACFALTYSFPLLNAAAGTGLTFWLYAVVCIAGYAFILRKLPETKGKALEDIERMWS